MLTINAEHYIDVGYGRPVELSSCHPNATAPTHLLPARNAGGIAFHTNLENGPFIIVDLLTIRRLKRIRIFNGEHLSARAIPLSVMGSFDNSSWQKIAEVDYDFGGRLTNPVEILVREQFSCRFVKLQVLNNTFLHLDYIEIAALLPSPELGRLRDIEVSDDDIRCTYYHHDSHGFAWTFTCTLTTIIACQNAGATISHVNYKLCMKEFKEDVDLDLYPILFTQKKGDRRRLPDELPGFERHGIYAQMPFDLLQPYIDMYFMPSNRVMAFEKFLIDKYDIELDKTIVLCYRGTDKKIEVAPADIESYVLVGKHLLNSFPGSKILVQTDQQQALLAIREELPKCLCFEELPVTPGDVAIHNLPAEQFGIDKMELGIRLLAAIHLLAGAKFLVTHTGNFGAWLALYRGTNDGLYQFDIQGNLRGPDGEMLHL